MRSGVIGTNFNDKKFGSVGSKLEQKMVNMEQKGRGNQVKKVKDFQLSQVFLVFIRFPKNDFSSTLCVLVYTFFPNNFVLGLKLNSRRKKTRVNKH